MRWPRAVGSLLVLVGVVGFVTIADDLRHTGEIFGVGSVVVIGLLILGAGFSKSASTRVAIYWLAVAVGIGAMAGAAVDNMPVGIGGGAAVGAVTAAVMSRRRGRVAE